MCRVFPFPYAFPMGPRSWPFVVVENTQILKRDPFREAKRPGVESMDMTGSDVGTGPATISVMSTSFYLLVTMFVRLFEFALRDYVELSGYISDGAERKQCENCKKEFLDAVHLDTSS